jgi:arylsulfatase A
MPLSMNQPMSSSRSTVAPWTGPSPWMARVGLVVWFLCGGIAHAFERPNIIFVLADDVGWGDIASYNANSLVELPSLERLAAEGIRFTDAHTSAAKCAPSRYSVITGNYQWRGKGAWGAWNYKGGSQILPGQNTLGDVLSNAGYTTAIVGKYHLGGDFYLKGSNTFASATTADNQVDFSRAMVNGALDRGFDYSFLALRGIQEGPYAYFENDRLVGLPNDLIEWTAGDYGDTEILKSGIGAPNWNTREVGPTLLAKALNFIDRHRSGSQANAPFFLYFNSEAVHSPRKPPVTLAGRPVLGSTGLGERTDMLVEIDVVVEQLLESLDKHGIADDTLFIFSSDNGALRPAPELKAGHDSNAGLRGAKGAIHEGGHRVPMIVKWGASGFRGSSLPGGTAVPGLVGVQDLFATFAELVGVVPGADQGRDSVSILPLLRGATDQSPRDHMIHESEGAASGQFLFAYRSGHWKLIFDAQDQPVEFYDLSTDLAERLNLIGQQSYADLITRLTADFRAARVADRTAPPVTNGNSPPSNLVATANSSVQISLSWKDNSNDETGFRIQRRTGANGTWQVLYNLGANVTAYSDNGLKDGTTYFYRLRALGSTDNSAFSNIAQATTPTGTSRPVAPSDVKATAISAKRVELTWTDNSDNETRFSIRRKVGAGGIWVTIAGVGANVTTYTDTGLESGTTYFYMVRSRNSAGTSTASNTAGVTTP